MKNTYLLKRILIFILSIVLIFSIDFYQKQVWAEEKILVKEEKKLAVSTIDESDPIQHPEKYKPGGGDGSDDIENFANIIIGSLQVVGTIAAVVMIMVIGMKYMIGSIEEKSKYKENMISYLVGIFFIFATPHIVRLIYNFVKK